MENQPALIEVPTNLAPVYPSGFYKGKPRPGYGAPEVLVSAVNKLLPEVMRWGKFGDDEAQGVSEQLLKAMHGERDGYKLAKYLEDRFSWDGDSELVDVLEGADFYGCHRDAIKAWIKNNAIVPAFAVGREVMVKLRGEGDAAGIIRSLSDDGMYCVMIPAKGHVESGLGVHGILFPWEDVEAWNER